MSDDVPVTDIGEMRNLTIIELDDGTQVLRVGGDHGESRIPIPEHMAVPFAETARRVVDAYESQEGQ